MRMTGRLEQDHGMLRSRLEMLEAALEQSTYAIPAIQQTCLSLAADLRDHISDEARIVASCAMALGRFGAEELDRFAIEHQDERHCLKVMARVLRGGRYSGEWLRAAVTTATAKLQRHMEEQETMLFPLLNDVLGRQFEDVEVEAPQVHYAPVHAAQPLFARVALSGSIVRP